MENFIRAIIFFFISIIIGAIILGSITMLSTMPINETVPSPTPNRDTIIIPSVIPTPEPTETPTFPLPDPRMSQNIILIYDHVELNVTNISGYTLKLTSITANETVVWNTGVDLVSHSSKIFNVINSNDNSVILTVNYDVIYNGKTIHLYITKAF